MLNLRRSFFHFILCVSLFILCIGIGLAVNFVRTDSIPLRYSSPASGFMRLEGASLWPSGISVVDATTIEMLVNNRAAFVLDARSDLFYEFGHIRSAENLSLKNFDTDYARLEALLLEVQSSDIPIVVYCSHQHCEDASKLAERLHQKGFPTILVYENGYDEWDQLGLPKGKSS